MKYIRIRGLIIFIMLITFFTFSSKKTFINAADDQIVISFEASSINENEFIVKANLIKNSGILAMNLDLIYDTSVMTLTNLEYSDTLKSLNPISTNTTTEKGLSIYPFKISYEGDKNDYSTGTLMVLTFKLKNDIKNKSYYITFGYQKDKSVSALQGNEIITKNLLIDQVKITTKNNKTDEIIITDSNISKNNYCLLYVFISLFIISVIVIIFIIIRSKKKKQKDWIKIQ